MRKYNSAFTLIEIIMVMVVVSIMATIIPRWLITKEPVTELNTVLNEFNDLLYYARQEAIATQKNYRLTFKSNITEPDFVLVEQEEKYPEDSSKKVYEQVFSSYFQTKYTLPYNIRMQALYHGKQNEFEQNKDYAYCYIIPNGLVQPIIIHIINKKDDQEDKVTFKIAPFLGKFELVENFVRLEK
ncbi:prepilin-type N-terminal cleavage/methylation domain-containing protein [Candidatus Dependentiae bacterium]|nr:prepilin-type N-terminal cleavage/methylation domain-containing protein [Candidatus Dependentiae bacterium]